MKRGAVTRDEVIEWLDNLTPSMWRLLNYICTERMNGYRSPAEISTFHQLANDLLQVSENAQSRIGTG